MFIARQRIDKHAPAATNYQLKIEILLVALFPIRPVRRRDVKFEDCVPLSSAKEAQMIWRSSSVEGMAGRQF
jgi:hypothetical protein